MKNTKLFGALIGFLLFAMIASALLMENVPPTHVGVKQNQWGGGVVKEDYSTGYHLGVTGVHKWYLLDRRTHFLTFADNHGAGNSARTVHPCGSEPATETRPGLM